MHWYFTNEDRWKKTFDIGRLYGLELKNYLWKHKIISKDILRTDKKKTNFYPFVKHFKLNILKYTQPSFFQASLIWISVYPDSEPGRPTNEFKQRTPPMLQEMADRWLPRLVNTVFCQIAPQMLRP